jgi:hypothetical protein
MYFCVNKMSLCETRILKRLGGANRRSLVFAAIFALLSLISPSPAANDVVPIVPIGDDAYLIWHYEIDGDDLIVKETATDDPVGANNGLHTADSTFWHARKWIRA